MIHEETLKNGFVRAVSHAGTQARFQTIGPRPLPLSMMIFPRMRRWLADIVAMLESIQPWP